MAGRVKCRLDEMNKMLNRGLSKLLKPAGLVYMDASGIYQ
jgi:hypothetical protein